LSNNESVFISNYDLIFDKIISLISSKTNLVVDDTPPENFLKMRKQNEDKFQKKKSTVDDELSERLKKLNEPKNKQG
jgi:hypothetical protein